MSAQPISASESAVRAAVDPDRARHGFRRAGRGAEARGRGGIAGGIPRAQRTAHESGGLAEQRARRPGLIDGEQLPVAASEEHEVVRGTAAGMLAALAELKA